MEQLYTVNEAVDLINKARGFTWTWRDLFKAAYVKKDIGLMCYVKDIAVIKAVTSEDDYREELEYFTGYFNPLDTEEGRDYIYRLAYNVPTIKAIPSFEGTKDGGIYDYFVVAKGALLLDPNTEIRPSVDQFYIDKADVSYFMNEEKSSVTTRGVTYSEGELISLEQKFKKALKINAESKRLNHSLEWVQLEIERIATNPAELAKAGVEELGEQIQGVAITQMLKKIAQQGEKNTKEIKQAITDIAPLEISQAKEFKRYTIEDLNACEAYKAHKKKKGGIRAKQILCIFNYALDNDYDLSVWGSWNTELGIEVTRKTLFNHIKNCLDCKEGNTSYIWKDATKVFAELCFKASPPLAHKK